MVDQTDIWQPDISAGDLDFDWKALLDFGTELPFNKDPPGHQSVEFHNNQATSVSDGLHYGPTADTSPNLLMMSMYSDVRSSPQIPKDVDTISNEATLSMDWPAPSGVHTHAEPELPVITQIASVSMFHSTTVEALQENPHPQDVPTTRRYVLHVILSNASSTRRPASGPVRGNNKYGRG